MCILLNTIFIDFTNNYFAQVTVTLFSESSSITKQMQSVKQHRSNVEINGKISAVIGSDVLDNASSTQRSDCVSSCHNVTLVFCRTITSAPYNRALNVIKDAEFTTASNILAARCGLYFKARNPKPKHKTSISEGDMEKLGQYFTHGRSNPDILVEAAWFYLSPGQGWLGFHGKGHICL